MATSTVTFLSYNSTGMNTLKTKWICDLINVTDASYIQIQEHLKRNKAIEKYFIDQFPDHNSFINPGHRDKYQDQGRPMGGLAQLSRSNLDVKTNRVKCDNFRVQAQVLTFAKVKLLWINAYMPTDPQLINYDETELLTILHEIEKIIENTEFDEIVFGADFNWDRSRPTMGPACNPPWA